VKILEILKLSVRRGFKRSSNSIIVEDEILRDPQTQYSVEDEVLRDPQTQY